MEQNGFSATSVDQIIEAAGSSKGAFFHHFDSKQALARTLVSRYVEADLELLAAGLAAAEQESDVVRRPTAFLRYYETWAEELVSAESACLYIAVLTERDLLDEAALTEIDRAVLAWRHGFAALLRPALRRRNVVIDADELADHLFATFEGGYLMCRAARSPEPMRRQLRVLRQLVEATLSHPGG